jgi:hypothetical protein
MLVWAGAAEAQFPEAQIANGAVTAKLYLPDAEKGYYRGTRFDWSGQIYSLRTLGHEYFGQWFEKYDPKLHDAIMGPVEEFRMNSAGLGYDEASPGGTFIRIGVGVVRKPEEPRNQNFRTYDIVDHGRWEVKPGRDRIEFTHHLRDQNGYGYRYTKIMRLVKNAPEMVIEHTLRNTGAKPIETFQYNHNFFVIDGQPTGPAASVKFPFDLQAVRPIPADLASLRGSEVTYLRELEKGQSVFTELKGYGSSASDFDVRIENSAAGAGVRITGDRPIARLVYWSIRTTLCPEPYIELKVEPGKETTWTYTYQFYRVGGR